MQNGQDFEMKSERINFKLGDQKWASEVTMLTKVNMTRGIHPVYSGDGKVESVVLLCTLSGIPYSNRWLNDEQTKLKYCMEYRPSHTDPFLSKNNTVIRNSKEENYPIHVLVRQNKSEKFTYRGIFEISDIKCSQTSPHFVLDKTGA